MTPYDQEFKNEILWGVRRLDPTSVQMKKDLYMQLFPEELTPADAATGTINGAHPVEFLPEGAMSMVQFFGPKVVPRRDVLRYDPPLENEAPADAINPDHYKTGGIEVIDILKMKLSPAEFAGFLKGNVLKYTLREGQKIGAEDLKKAAWYSSMLAGVDPRHIPTLI